MRWPVEVEDQNIYIPIVVVVPLGGTATDGGAAHVSGCDFCEAVGTGWPLIGKKLIGFGVAIGRKVPDLGIDVPIGHKQVLVLVVVVVEETRAKG